MSARRTYEVSVHWDALRSFKVAASSAEEAMDIAGERAEKSVRSVREGSGWSLSMAGSLDEHFIVSLDDVILGPWGDGSFDDNPKNEEDDS